MIYHLFLGLGAFVMALLGVRLAILGLKQKRNFMMHKSGGMALVITLLIFLLVREASYLVIAGMLLLATVFALEDWIDINPMTRLGVQLFAVLIASHELALLPVLQHYLPPGVALALLTVAWLWVINLFSAMDGTDGLAGSEAVCIAGGIVLILLMLGKFGHALSLDALMIGAATLGFTWWSWPPARIALKSVGSVPLGFLLGYLLLSLAGHGYAASALILPAYLLVDGGYTLVMRIAKHPQYPHFYQRAVDAGKAPGMVVREVIGMNLLLALLAVYAALNPDIDWLFTCVGYAMVIAVLGFNMAHPIRYHRTTTAKNSPRKAIKK